MTKYFKGLDTLRAIAALVVVWGHIELLKKNASVPNLIDNDFAFFPSGHIAVILFFVLSGFLITYLLVKEKETTGSISLKKFYMRRILRIWPLYYAIILLSYILINTEYTTKTIVLCLSIFPNVAHALSADWPSSPQIWSIGVEEQFYLFWPLVLLILPEKRMTGALILFFVGYSLLPHLFDFINTRTFRNDEMGLVVNEFFYGTKFNCMAIGALMGFSLAKGKKWIQLLSNDIVVLLSVLVAFGLWFFRFQVWQLTYEFFSVLFSIMIVGVVNSRRISIDTGISRFLGRISYGIYMYHWIVMVIVSGFIKYEGNQVYYNILLYTTVISGTIFISWISHITLERFFLNLKQR